MDQQVGQAESSAGAPIAFNVSEISGPLRNFGDFDLERRSDFLIGDFDRSIAGPRTSSRPFAAMGEAMIGGDMVRLDINSPISRMRERWNDPLLTTLTVLLILMLFVFAPLQAVGIRIFQVLGFVSASGLIAGVFFMSGSATVMVALLGAFIMAATGAVSRLSAPSILDIYLFAGGC